MESEKPLVSVICMTYNHAPYIVQTLEGFVAQRCDFPFEVIVHDDASTDGTADIIRAYCTQYPALFRPIIQEQNQYSQGNDVCDLLYFQKSCGRYIAICEGDDYWTDPLKLQKQVDFLEAHTDYGMVYSKAQSYDQSSQTMGSVIGTDRCDLSSMLSCNPTPTLTALFRRNLLVSYFAEIRPIEQQWKMGDYPLWLYIAAHSKIWFMNEVVGVYRMLPNSASHSTDRRKQFDFTLSAYDVKLFFAQRYFPQMVDTIRLKMLFLCLRYGCDVLDRKLVHQTRREIRQMSGVKMLGKQRVGYIVSRFPRLYCAWLAMKRRSQERSASRKAHKRSAQQKLENKLGRG